jgi:flavodoxin
VVGQFSIKPGGRSADQVVIFQELIRCDLLYINQFDGCFLPECFLDGMGILGEIMEAQGARLVGFTSTEEYTYESSRAERGDQFIGLGIDFETQGTKNKDRVNGWVGKLKLELK